MRIYKSLYLALPLMGLTLVSCESDSLLTGSEGNEVPVHLSAPMLAGSGDAEGTLPAATSVYVFSNGALTQSLTVNPGETADFTVLAENKVYAVAGVDMPSMAAGSSFEKLAAATVTSPSGAASAPDFYTGVGVLNETADGMEVTLRHGVARLDVACRDPKIVMSEVSVEGAPAASYVLASDNPLESAGTVTYRRAIGEDFDGILEQAFTVYESAKPVTVRVKGTYDGDPMNFTATIPVVERNKIYTLGVSGGTDLTGEITIADWVAGDMGDGVIILGETAIDMEHSLIPAGVTINKVDNTITFPIEGVKDMKIAFRTSAPLSIRRQLGETERISVQPGGSKADGDSFITTFIVNVPAQPKCGTAYDATLVFEGSTEFFLNMMMVDSPFQIPTVRMAGVNWMCFNAVSDDVDDQIYVAEGMTVDQMYNEHFEDCLGMYFQYGRIFSYSPWQGSDPTAHDDVARDIPWQTVGKMPLPKGFHVASAAEWKALTPPNGTIPARYTSAGDSIHASVVTLDGTLQTPSATINAMNYKKRYVLFESITTGNKLYVPFFGIKEAQNKELPSANGAFRFETRSSYWIREDRYVWLLDFKDRGEGVEGADMGQNRWNYNGFMGVRGVKD